jgi:GntR family transcriptional regulator, rspAB operon transcriptional repressor
MSTLVPLSRRRASDSVYEALRQAILTRAFLPGQRLNVNELAEQLGVSPTPVKDALTRLEAEALIEIRPRSGTFVTSLSPEDVAESFEIRAALECLAAEKALAHVTAADIAQLRAWADDIAVDDDAETSRLRHETRNADFHKRIVMLSHNRRLIQMYEGLDAHIQIARIHRGHGDWKRRLASERREHLAIVTALAGKKRQALVSALRQHIMRAAESLVQDLRELETGQARVAASLSAERASR